MTDLERVEQAIGGAILPEGGAASNWLEPEEISVIAQAALQSIGIKEMKEALEKIAAFDNGEHMADDVWDEIMDTARAALNRGNVG